MDNTYSKHIKKPYPENLFCTILETDHYAINDDFIMGLNHVLNQLPQRSQQILTLRYKERLTLSKIAHKYSITNSRIRDIIEHACKTLRLYKYKTYLVKGFNKASEEAEHMKIHGIEAMYDLPISSLELSNRSTWKMTYAGIRTVGDLVAFIHRGGQEWHHKIRNLGIVSKKEVEKELMFHGFILHKD